MRTLTSLIVLPLVVLAPLLMAPGAYAIEVEPRPTVFVTVQANELVATDNPEIKAGLTVFAIGSRILLSGQGLVRVPSEGGITIGLVDVGIALHEPTLTSTGIVIRSTDPDLLRTPVAIRANATDSAIVFVFGPILSGRLAGQTFTFKGVGTVLIVCLDCRSD